MLLHDELLAEKNPLFVRKFYSKDYRRQDSFSGPDDLTEAPSGSAVTN